MATRTLPISCPLACIAITPLSCYTCSGYYFIRNHNLKQEGWTTSEALSSSTSLSEQTLDGNEYAVPFNMFFSLSLLASMRAASNSAFASGLSSPINFSGEGQTRGSADDGFSRAAQDPCFLFNATIYGILLQIPSFVLSLYWRNSWFYFGMNTFTGNELISW